MRSLLPLFLALALSGIACGGDSSTPDAPIAADVAVRTDAPEALDAPASLDAPTIDAARVADGVVCSGTTPACAVGEICCEMPSGISCEAPSSVCTLALACDGPEDCPDTGPRRCCSNGGETSCQPCADGEVICHDDGDCLVSETCCPIGGAIPLGALMHCTTLGMGEACPAPP